MSEVFQRRSEVLQQYLLGVLQFQTEVERPAHRARLLINKLNPIDGELQLKLKMITQSLFLFWLTIAQTYEIPKPKVKEIARITF